MWNEQSLPTFIHARDQLLHQALRLDIQIKIMAGLGFCGIYPSWQSFGLQEQIDGLTKSRRHGQILLGILSFNLRGLQRDSNLYYIMVLEGGCEFIEQLAKATSTMETITNMIPLTLIIVPRGIGDPVGVRGLIQDGPGWRSSETSLAHQASESNNQRIVAYRHQGCPFRS